MNSTATRLISAFMLIAAAFGFQGCNGQYGNIAAFHPAWHSSALDYDHTAQLVTDGIPCEGDAAYYDVLVNGERMELRDRGWLFDYRSFTHFDVVDTSLAVEIQFHGTTVDADRVEIRLKPRSPRGAVPELAIDVEVTEDGCDWVNVGTITDIAPLYDHFGQSLVDKGVLDFGSVKSISGVRYITRSRNILRWEVSTVDLMLSGEKLDICKIIPFTSCWISEGRGNEWVYVDLGERKSFDRVELDWVNRPAGGEIQVSNDLKKWRKIASFTDEDVVRCRAKARYVKVLAGEAAEGDHVMLGEMKVFGRMDAPKAGSDWYVVRADMADDTTMRVPVSLPSTVLAAYIDAGMLPDPSYADDNRMISDSYFMSDFIYRGQMEAPEDISGRTFLNFDGVNWKADVTFNGTPLTPIEGAFIRTKYDVTGLVRPGKNDVEVYVHANDHPSTGKGNCIRRNAYNGGILGADNPTFHASIGWDWIPSVHGRNMGIWNDVYFTTAGDVTIEDPFVYSKLNLPDTTEAAVTVGAVLRNRSDRPVSVTLSSMFGEHPASVEVELGPLESREVSSLIDIDSPRLWWPNGYGEQNLYDVRMTATVDGVQTDVKEFSTGIRENSYSTENGHLTVWVNGRRFSGRGGNWGFSEFNLRFREREYDTAVRLHAEENFTMIRNWVGQTMDDEFYEACDRYGIMVWQDFWLANPLDGPDPYDEKMFMANAEDLVRRIRIHPSIVIYVGRNEGVPPASLNTALSECVARNHHDIFYAPDSSHGLLGGNGHYRRQSAETFFSEWTENPRLWGQDRVHSEKGMPNVPNYESVVKFIPEEDLWPQGAMWAIHDWTQESAQRVGTFNEAVESMFGEAKDAEQFCEWAQWVNFDGYRAIFESRSEQRRGLQLWMSHAAWPTFVWCTYDYYFDPTGAFFGCKKACEPLHIQWNPLKKVVEVVNISGGNREGLKATGFVLDMYGKELARQEFVLDSREDTTVPCFGMTVPDEDVYYYKLVLAEGDAVVSDNFYVLGRETDNFKALLGLPAADLRGKQDVKDAGDRWEVTLTLRCVGKVPAMMVRLMARSRGERVLPVHYSDNYFHMMPGETRTVKVWLEKRDCEGRPDIRVTTFNR